MSVRNLASRAALASGLVLAAIVPTAAVAAPAHAAQTPAQHKISYTVQVKPGVLQNGQTTIKANVAVVNPQQNVSSWWSKAAINAVVKKAVNNGYQMPFQAQGFRCTPTVKGNTTTFLCSLRGADVPTTVWLAFSAHYA